MRKMIIGSLIYPPRTELVVRKVGDHYRVTVRTTKARVFRNFGRKPS